MEISNYNVSLSRWFAICWFAPVFFSFSDSFPLSSPCGRRSILLLWMYGWTILYHFTCVFSWSIYNAWDVDHHTLDRDLNLPLSRWTFCSFWRIVVLLELSLLTGLLGRFPVPVSFFDVSCSKLHVPPLSTNSLTSKVDNLWLIINSFSRGHCLWLLSLDNCVWEINLLCCCSSRMSVTIVVNLWQLLGFFFWGSVLAQVSSTLIVEMWQWFFSVASRPDCVCWSFFGWGSWGSGSGCTVSSWRRSRASSAAWCGRL